MNLSKVDKVVLVGVALAVLLLGYEVTAGITGLGISLDDLTNAIKSMVV